MVKKKVQGQGAQIPKNSACIEVFEVPGDAAQYRYWAFYEAIICLSADYS